MSGRQLRLATPFADRTVAVWRLVSALDLAAEDAAGDLAPLGPRARATVLRLGARRMRAV